jgi:transposase
VKKITEAMQRMVIPGEPIDDGTEMVQQLKEKFQSTAKRNEQLQVLTVLPKSWSVKKIQQEFGVSTYMARKSKKLVEEKGILSLPDPVRGPSLLQETVDIVCAFYESDDISRVMPGKKDFVSVKKEGKRQHIQKRLVLSNLREVYHEFKERFPDQKIGFSKFADLRPKHCILAGASGTHCVHNTSKCKVNDDGDTTTRATYIPPLFGKNHVQPPTS